jgi:hypothetical protein
LKLNRSEIDEDHAREWGRWHRALHWVIDLRRSPESIAAGFSVGLFVAFTPTLGFQMLLAAFLATLVGASRASAVVPVWITNPVTVPPIYGFTYMVGGWFYPGPPVKQIPETLRGVARRLAQYEFWDMIDQIRTLVMLGRDVFVPLWIGGIAVGLAAGLTSYYPMLIVTNRMRRFFHEHRPALLRRPGED